MEIIYNSFKLSLHQAQLISRRDTLEKPVLSYCCNKKNKYCIVMVDFDAPQGYSTNKSFGPEDAPRGFDHASSLFPKEIKHATKSSIIPETCCNNFQFLHWIVCDASFNSKGKLINSRELIEYYPPSPPQGTHRYFFYIFYQPNEIVSYVIERKNFDLQSFIDKNNLVYLDSMYYLVEAT